MTPTTSTSPTSMSWTALTVTADLPNGYATAHPWGIALDGLLAAQLWQDRITEHPADTIPWPSTAADPPDLDLPLARCTPKDAPHLWHWAATCSQPVPPAGSDGAVETEVHYRSHHLDHRPMEALTGAVLPAALSPRSGMFRSRRMPLIVTICTAVTWSAVGDPDAIARLLKPIAAIGKKRGHGEGAVSRWRIEPSPDRSLWEAAHLHLDGTLGRPTPQQCLPPDHQEGPTLRAGLRPPLMHPSRQHDLYVPTERAGQR